MNKSGIKPERTNGPKKWPQKVLVLENIRSVHNVGAIFRTADAIGIDKIYLVGLTPSPIDRFGRARQDLHKASLGAEKNVNWEHSSLENASDLIKNLKKNDFLTIALEQSKNAVDYKKVSEKIKNSKDIFKKVAVLVGNEIEGVSVAASENVEIVSDIPMGGIKESLNVSVATGIFLYRLFDF